MPHIATQQTSSNELGTPRYTATTAHTGSVEHIVDDRDWSQMGDDEREDFFLDEELDHAAPTPTAGQLDQITSRLDALRRDLQTAVRRLPDRALPAVFALAVATDHLRAAAVALDHATDQIEAIEADRTDQAAADDAWADPDWQVDSTTRPCCGGIGSHTRECTAQPVAYTLTDAAIAAL